MSEEIVTPDELALLATVYAVNQKAVSSPVQDILRAERERIARWAERREMPSLAFNLRMMDGNE